MSQDDVNYVEYWKGFMSDTDDQPFASKEDAANKFFLNPFSASGKHFTFVFNMQTTEIEKAIGVKDILGYDDETFTNELLYSTYHPDDFDKYFATIHEAFMHATVKGETEPLDTVLSMTCRNRHSAGHYVHLHYKMAIIATDKEGQILKIVALCKDISLNPFVKFTAKLACKCNNFKTSFIHEDEKFSANYKSILSKRELQILELVVTNKTSSEIALILSISKYTVEKHISNTFKKANVRNRTELLELIS